MKPSKVLIDRLRDLTDIVSDRDGSRTEWVVRDRWYRDASMLADLGPALANLFDDADPTVVVGPHASGYLLGPLVATHLNVGFVQAMKEPGGGVTDSDRWHIRTTRPDYLDRHLTMGWRNSLISAGDRVLCVDDLIETGSQVEVLRRLVVDAGAAWIGAAIAVDDLSDSRLRRELDVRSLVYLRDL